jgi:hypothetical protein
MLIANCQRMGPLPYSQPSVYYYYLSIYLFIVLLIQSILFIYTVDLDNNALSIAPVNAWNECTRTDVGA